MPRIGRCEDAIYTLWYGSHQTMRSPRREKDSAMPIYALHDHQPTLPAPGRYWIAPGAQVMGRVTLGDEVGIWFNAVLRADNEPIEIGARTNIQDGAVLHNDPGFPLRIGSGCTIGHAAIVHGCTIGDNTLVGMGATILNGAVIGSNCLIGANALVTEGKVFPDNSLIVGAPAKAVRVLDEATLAHLRRAAQTYVARLHSYANGLVEVDG